MRIGVVGDTHNQLGNVNRIVELFREAEVERIIHTGDITQPKVLECFASLDRPLLGVFGNNDLPERERLTREAERLGMDILDPPRHFEWAGRRIMVVHDPDDYLPSAHPELDLVLHGHTHRHRHERAGQTLIFNPGECAGFMAGRNSVGVVDLLELDAEVLKF
ncbi:MAG: YfcE family phosphodiesterase [Myxococcota bacterium]